MNANVIRVATVDDNAIARRAVKEILSRFNGRTRFECVAEYPTGDAAVEGLVAVKADVVLLDVFMPGLNGIETLHRLRRVEHPRHPVVIKLSGCDDPRVIDYCFHLGAAAYIIKPVEGNALCQAIMDALSARSHWPSHLAEVLPEQEIARQSRELLAAYSRRRLFAKVGANEPERRRMILRANGFQVAGMANGCGCSLRTLERRIRCPDGLTPAGHLDSLAREEARELLSRRVPIEVVAEQLGYGSLSAFCRACHRWFGLPASAVAGKSSQPNSAPFSTIPV